MTHEYSALQYFKMFKQPWVGESYENSGLWLETINKVLHQCYISNESVFHSQRHTVESFLFVGANFRGLLLFCSFVGM